MRRVLAVVIVAACGRIDFDDDVAVGIVQAQATFASGSTDTSLEMSPTRAGDLLVVVTANVAAATTAESISDDANDAFVSANATIVQASSLGEIWYVASARAGATTVTVTDSAEANRELWVIEIRGAHELDTELAVSNMPDTGVFQGPSVTPSQLPALLVTQVDVDGEVQSVSSPFTALDVEHGDDAAFALVSTAGSYGPTWTVDETGTFGASTLAFTTP